MLGITDFLLMCWILVIDTYHNLFNYTPDYIKGEYEPGNPQSNSTELHNFVIQLETATPIHNVPGHPVTGWKQGPAWEEWGYIPREDYTFRITPMYNFYKGMKAYDE